MYCGWAQLVHVRRLSKVPTIFHSLCFASQHYAFLLYRSSLILFLPVSYPIFIHSVVVAHIPVSCLLIRIKSFSFCKYQTYFFWSLTIGQCFPFLLVFCVLCCMPNEFEEKAKNVLKTNKTDICWKPYRIDRGAALSFSDFPSFLHRLRKCALTSKEKQWFHNGNGHFLNSLWYRTRVFLFLSCQLLLSAYSAVISSTFTLFVFAFWTKEIIKHFIREKYLPLDNLITPFSSVFHGVSER